MSEDSLVFDKEKFGNIFKKKRRIEGHIRGIQRTLEAGEAPRLEILEKQLQYKYEKVLVSEIEGELG